MKDGKKKLEVKPFQDRYIRFMKKKTQLFIIHGENTFKSDKDYFHYLKTRPIPLEKSLCKVYN